MLGLLHCVASVMKMMYAREAKILTKIQEHQRILAFALSSCYLTVLLGGNKVMNQYETHLEMTMWGMHKLCMKSQSRLTYFEI